MNLFQLTDDLRIRKSALEDLLDDSQGEITPEIEAFEAEIDQVFDRLGDKVDAYAKIRAEFLAEAEALRGEEKRLALRRRSRESAVDRLERRLVDAMILGKTDKLNTPTHTVSVSKSYSVGLLVTDDQIPDEWARIKREPKKAELLKALREGKRFQFAELVERSGVRIR
jgi:hypothetical protein